jgi:hypothetical protein
MEHLAKIDLFSLKYLTVYHSLTEYTSEMNTRIAEFERLWITTVFLPMPPLRRSTNICEVLSDEDRERWVASSYGEREAIEQEHRIKNGLDNMFGDPTTVPYYECDDDDDMRWLE